MRPPMIYTTILLLLAMPLFSGAQARGDEASPVRLSEKYPDLSRGILFQAKLESLEGDGLVRIGDKIIGRDMLARKMDEIPEEAREQAVDYVFYLLEEMVTEPILLTLILGRDDLPEDQREVQRLFREYISKIIDGVEISEEEARTFYDGHPQMFTDMAFEDVREELQVYLLNEKQRELWSTHVRDAGLKTSLAVNAEWVADQVVRVKDNPVDEARANDKPTLAVFTADWCPACKQLKPVLESIQEKYEGKVTVVVVDTDEAGFLAKRYEVSGIPLLVFFGKDGAELERHAGFIEEDALVTKLEALMGS